MMTIRCIITRGVLAGSLLLSANTMADTMTGHVDATIEVMNTCEINGTSDGKTQNFGTLNFGKVTTLFRQVDGELTQGISVKCAPGQASRLTISGNSTGTPFTMNNAQTGWHIGYKIYSDSARSKELTKGDTISIIADGSAKEIPIYARAFGNNNALKAGTYRDTLYMTIDF